MTLGETARTAVRNSDPILAGKAADVLRFRFGMTYDEIYAWVNELEPISKPAWETLMEMADSEEP